jgi:hypothetical protein
VAFSMAWAEARAGAGDEKDQARGWLAGFRRELYRCLGRRADALFEACDAVLCKPDRVHMLAELSLEPECRRGHGAVYDALNCGQSSCHPGLRGMFLAAEAVRQIRGQAGDVQVPDCEIAVAAGSGGYLSAIGVSVFGKDGLS